MHMCYMGAATQCWQRIVQDRQLTVAQILSLVIGGAIIFMALGWWLKDLEDKR